MLDNTYGQPFTEVVALIQTYSQEGFWYLAQPYSGSDAEHTWRYQQGMKYKAKLIHQGIIVYAPIVENHPIAEAYGLPTGWEFWKRFDEAMVGAAKGVIVLTLKSWQKSKGVREEINIASEQNKPVIYYNPYA